MDLNSINTASIGIWWFLLYLPVLLWAIRSAPWHIVREKDASNIWFATLVAVLLLWQIKVDIFEQQLFVHLLGGTILLLMFGWSFAIVSHALVLLGHTLYGSADLYSFALNALITGVIPISVSYWVWRFNERFLPPNYFSYVFVAAFLGGALAMLATAVSSYFVLMQWGQAIPVEFQQQYVTAFFLLLYPEAFFTGGALSIFVAFRPQWVATFDDRRYLRKKDPDE